MLRGLLPFLWVLPAVWAASVPHPGASTFGCTGSGRLGTVEDGGLVHSCARSLPFYYDLYTFRGDAGSTAIVASFAVPVGSLEKEDRDREVRYRFDVTLVLSDTALRSVSRTDDSVFVALPRPLHGDHLFYTHIEVQAPPSATTWQRVIMTDATTPGTGQLYSSVFPIPDYGGADLMLSDIALGQPEAEAGWRRGDVTLALLPTSQFPEGSFDIYYEIYNLPHGDPYTTELTIERLDGAGDGSDVVRTTFSGEAATRPDGSLPELRRVDATLGRGRYLLTVTITDEVTGRTARRSRPFQVRGWEPGTTLVPALPESAGRRGPDRS